MKTPAQKDNLITSVAQRIALLGLWLSLSLSPRLLPGQQAVSSQSLEALLAGATSAFSSGEFTVAADLFQQIERDFGRESIFRNPLFLRRILPIKGIAELQSGAPGQAVATLTAYLELSEREAGDFPNLLYLLATAHRQNNEPAKALRTLQDFISEDPAQPHAALAALQQAEILVGMERSAEAFRLLQQFSRSSAPPTLIAQGRLFAVREAVREKQLDLAANFLFEIAEQGIETFPEVAVLTFAAIELGDHLVEAGKAPIAVRAYRLALPRRLLIEQQEKRLETLNKALSTPVIPSAQPWSSYLKALQERMETQLVALRNADDYTDSLTLRRGQALLLADRHREAWLLFESLAMNPYLSADVRAQAHYRWILAAAGLEHWEDALAVARNFTLRYPRSELASAAFYLIAQAHRERHRHPEAIEVLTDLIENFPEHPLYERWLLERGLSHTSLTQFVSARFDFNHAREKNKEGSVTAEADMWHALTHFFEGEYAAALKEWEHLTEIYRGHPLEGEMIYRHATTLYAARDLTKGLDKIRNFSRRFHRHSRYGEARLLEGEILSATGEYQEALEAYQKVPSEKQELFVHAIFQTGKILRLRGDYPAIISHFTAYIERDNDNISPRISEAVYWVGWAHTQMEKPEKARRLFREALEVHGDRRNAREVLSLLDMLARLESRQNGSGAFEAWIEDERSRAMESGRYTWFARLTLHLSQTLEARNSLEDSEILLREIACEVPAEKLDAACLAALGYAFLKKAPLSAEALFKLLLDDFPASLERYEAFFGLGSLALERNEPGRALSWLRLINRDSNTFRRAPEAALLSGDASMRMAAYTEAAEHFESVLLMRSARGRLHALALKGMAEAFEAQGRGDRAIAAYQRIYTLYRAYPELVADAYFKSALLFERRGDPASAFRTFSEMLEIPALKELPLFHRAQEEKARLIEQLPDEELELP